MKDSQFSKHFCENFMDWLEGLIDAKSIDVAQPIWPILTIHKIFTDKYIELEILKTQFFLSWSF